MGVAFDFFEADFQLFFRFKSFEVYYKKKEAVLTASFQVYFKTLIDFYQFYNLFI